MSKSQADAGAAAVPAGVPAADFAPELVFADGEDTGEDDMEAVAADADRVTTPDGSGAGGADGGEDAPGRFGYVPCYRTFRDRWFWEEKPWDVAHLFMELLLRANRKPRFARYGGKLIKIERGTLPTSYSKLAEDSGRDRKTVTTWLQLLADDGELSVASKGQHGIVITMLKYGTYALDGKQGDAERGQPMGQSGTRSKGRSKGQKAGQHEGQ